jgi:hypothetical protein
MSEKDSILLIKKYIDEYNLQEQFSFNGDIFYEKIKLGEKVYGVAGIFFKDNPNLIANHIFENNNLVDILMLINMEDNIVIFRKSKNVEIDLSKLAKQLSKGGGSSDIAGCIFNDKILNLTKLLKPLHEK